MLLCIILSRSYTTYTTKQIPMRSTCYTAYYLLYFLTVSQIEADSPSSTRPDTTGSIYPLRVAMLVGSLASFRHIGLNHVEQNWYTGEKAERIRWRNDWKGHTYLNMDKGGHFMSGLFTASTVTQTASWAGFNPKTSVIFGTLISWSALFEIEMRDAYFAEWGFSIPDFTANTIGASIPLIYTLFPKSRDIQFKFGYYPSTLYLNRIEKRSKSEPHINHVIDDYEGMSFWISLPSKKILPQKFQSKIPQWTRLAFGYGAVGLHGSNKKSRGQNKGYPERPDASPEVFIGLDYDTKHLPGSHRIWRNIRKQLNWLRLPAPAVRVYPDIRFYLIML